MRSGPNTTIKLILKEVGETKGSGLAKLDKKGNISVEQIIKVAQQRMEGMHSYTLKNAVKEVAGACMPMGVLCEGMSPKDFAKKVDEGVYDDEINNKKTTLSDEKKKQLAEQLRKAQAESAGDLAEMQKKKEAQAQKAAQKAAKEEGGEAKEAPSKEEKPAKE